MIRYTIGIYFNETFDKVALMLKNRPISSGRLPERTR